VAVCVVLEEAHYNALAAEAEAQRLPFGQFFQEWLARASMYGW
jgi:hypothetical protein